MPSPSLEAQPIGPLRALVEAWLRADFFGGAGQRGSGAPLVTALAFQSFCSSIFAILLFGEMPAVDFYLATLAFAGLLVALTVMGDLGAVLRDARLARVVAAAPIAPGVFLRARLLHAGVYLGLVATATALPPAVLSLWVGGGPHACFAYLAAALHQAVVLGLVMVALQSLRGGGGRWLGWLQSVLVLGALLLFFLGLRYLPDLPALRAEHGAWFAWAPPAWFAGEILLVAPPREAFGLAGAWVLVGLAVTAALLTFVALRGARGLAESDATASAQKAVRAFLPWRGICAPRASLTERAAYDFALDQLARDREFRLRAYPLFGFPFAMLGAGFITDEREDQGLYLNLVLYTLNAYLPIVLSFLAVSPHWRARWIFHVAPLESRQAFERGVMRALVVHLLIPVYAGLALAYAFLRSPLEALYQVPIAFLVALLLLPRSYRGAVGAAPFTHPLDRMHAVGGEGDRAGAPVFGLGIGLAIASLPAYLFLSAPLPAATALLILGVAVAGAWRTSEHEPFPVPSEEESE
jgi:ABC-2 type transport system permease protein